MFQQTFKTVQVLSLLYGYSTFNEVNNSTMLKQMLNADQQNSKEKPHGKLLHSTEAIGKRATSIKSLY